MFGQMQGVEPPRTSESVGAPSPEAISQLRSDVLSLERRFLQRIDDEAQRTSQRIEAELQRAIAQVRADVSIVQAQMERDRLAVSGVEAASQQLRTELTSQRELNDKHAESGKTVEDLMKSVTTLQSELPSIQEKTNRMTSDLHRNFQEVADSVALQSDHLSKVDTICRELASRNDDLDRKIREVQQDQLAEIVGLRARFETGEEERHGLLGKVSKVQTSLQEEEGKRAAEISAISSRLAKAEGILGSSMGSTNMLNESLTSDIQTLRSRLEAVEAACSSAAALARDTQQMARDAQKSDQSAVLTTRVASVERALSSGTSPEVLLSRVEAMEKSFSGMGTPASLLTRIGAIEHQVSTGSAQGPQVARIDALERQMSQALQIASGDNYGAASAAATQAAMLQQSTELNKLRGDLERLEEQLLESRNTLDRPVASTGQASLNTDDIRATLDIGLKKCALELGQTVRGEMQTRIQDASAKLRTDIDGDMKMQVAAIQSRAASQQENFQTELRQVAAAFGAYIKKAESSQNDRQEVSQLGPRVGKVEEEMKKTTRLVTNMATTILEERKMKTVTASNLEAIEAGMRDMLGTASTGTGKTQSECPSSPRNQDAQPQQQLAQLLLELGSSKVPSVSGGDAMSLNSEPNPGTPAVSNWRSVEQPPLTTAREPSGGEEGPDGILSDGLKESLEDLVFAVERTLLNQNRKRDASPGPVREQSLSFSKPRAGSPPAATATRSQGAFPARTKSLSLQSPPSSVGPSARRMSPHLGSQASPTLGSTTTGSTRAASHGYPSSDSVDNSRGGLDLSINRTRTGAVQPSSPQLHMGPGSMTIPIGAGSGGSIRVPVGGAGVTTGDEEVSRNPGVTPNPRTMQMPSAGPSSGIAAGGGSRPSGSPQPSSINPATRPGSVLNQRPAQRSPQREGSLPSAGPAGGLSAQSTGVPPAGGAYMSRVQQMSMNVARIQR